MTMMNDEDDNVDDDDDGDDGDDDGDGNHDDGDDDGDDVQLHLEIQLISWFSHLVKNLAANLHHLVRCKLQTQI